MTVSTRRAFTRPAKRAVKRSGAQPSASILHAAARFVLAATQALRPA